MCAYVSLGRASGPLGEVSQGFGGMWGGVESIGECMDRCLRGLEGCGEE